MSIRITDIEERYSGRLGKSSIANRGARVWSFFSIENRFELYVDDMLMNDGPDRALVREQCAHLAHLGRPAHKLGYLFFPCLSGCFCTLIENTGDGITRDIVDNDCEKITVGTTWTFPGSPHYYIRRYDATYSGDSGVVSGATSSTLLCVGKNWSTDYWKGSTVSVDGAIPQTRLVLSNSYNSITVSPVWTPAPIGYDFTLEQTLSSGYGDGVSGDTTTLTDTSKRTDTQEVLSVGDDYVVLDTSSMVVNFWRNATILDLETDKDDIKSVITGNTSTTIFVSAWRKKPEVGDSMRITFWPDDSLVAEPWGPGYLSSYTFYSEI